jgi:hypothetical protein
MKIKKVVSTEETDSFSSLKRNRISYIARILNQDKLASDKYFNRKKNDKLNVDNINF